LKLRVPTAALQAFEMLLRPWLPAPDLEHADEFVA